MRPLIVAIHGILTGQTDPSWPDKFHGYCERHVDVSFLKKEYEAGPFPAWNTYVKNPRLARALANEIELLVGDETIQKRTIHFIAHSNGTDIALRTIKLLAAKNIFTTSFIAVGSVLNPDVEKNGLAELVANGDVETAFAYCSRGDAAIGIAARIPSAYSRLGITGWRLRGAPYESPDFKTHWRDEFGHGTWFDREHIDATFTQALHDFGLPIKGRNVSNENSA